MFYTETYLLYFLRFNELGLCVKIKLKKICCWSLNFMKFGQHILKAAYSVTFDLLILEFFFSKNTVKHSNSGKHFNKL